MSDSLINEAPYANTKPARYSTWILDYEHGDYSVFKCARCSNDVKVISNYKHTCNYKFCPYCGAEIINTSNMNTVNNTPSGWTYCANADIYADVDDDYDVYLEQIERVNK